MRRRPGRLSVENWLALKGLELLTIAASVRIWLRRDKRRRVPL